MVHSYDNLTSLIKEVGYNFDTVMVTTSKFDKSIGYILGQDNDLKIWEVMKYNIIPIDAVNNIGKPKYIFMRCLESDVYNNKCIDKILIYFLSL